MQIPVVGEKWLEMVVKRIFRSVANFEQQCLEITINDYAINGAID